MSHKPKNVERNIYRSVAGTYYVKCRGYYQGNIPTLKEAREIRERINKAATTPNGLRDHCLLPDTQVRSGVSTEHIQKAAELIVQRKPGVIVMIGDWWDMPSLSTYASQKEAEGRRVKADIEAGNRAMRAFRAVIDAAISPDWNPRMVFCIGNHEERLMRLEKSNPALAGIFSYDDLALDGWEVVDFHDVIEIDGIHYSHYFYNPMSGKPLGGSAMTMLNRLNFSFVQGHRQCLDYAMKPLNNGQIINGLVSGAFYTHDEDYKGPQGNHHYRGMNWLHDVRDGNYDLEVISIERLMKGAIK